MRNAPMPIPTSDDSLELVKVQARALVPKWQTAEPWNSDEIKTAEVLLKRLRCGAEPHSDLLEALDANRYADGTPPNPVPI